MKHNKKEPWRIILFSISLLYIVFTWVKKDLLTIYTTMPAEQVVPVIATTIAVSLAKIAAIAGGVFLVKWIVNKRKRK